MKPTLAPVTSLLRRLRRFALSLGGIAVLMGLGFLALMLLGPTTQYLYDVDLGGTPAVSVSAIACGVERPGRVAGGRAQGRHEARCDDVMTIPIRYADHVVVCELGYVSGIPFGGSDYSRFRIVDRTCEYIPGEHATDGANAVD